MFVFGDFNIHHKDWLTYSVGIDRPGELCYDAQMVNFPTQVPDCDSHSPAHVDIFIFSGSSISSERCSMGDIFKFSAFAAASKFC